MPRTSYFADSAILLRASVVENTYVDVNNKRVLVVGLGKSGVASALFLKAKGARVSVSDAKPENQFRDEIPVLLDHGISVETGGHGERTFRGQDLIVVSPGVPVDAAPLVQARSMGETVIGEIEQFVSHAEPATRRLPDRMARQQPRRWQARS